MSKKQYMDMLFSAIIGYFFGSFPTAYLILKKKRGIDIRTEGSGNVGTLNSFEVTNSKKIGISVLFIDVLKGVFSVFMVIYFIGDHFNLQITALLFAVLGHCYSIWIKFKGGRGLATAAGGALLISPLILIIWALSWKLIHLFKKNIHIANILATFSVIICSIIFGDLINSLSIVNADSNIIFSFSVSLVMIIILSKHIYPLIDYLQNSSRI